MNILKQQIAQRYQDQDLNGLPIRTTTTMRKQIIGQRMDDCD